MTRDASPPTFLDMVQARERLARKGGEVLCPLTLAAAVAVAAVAIAPTALGDGGRLAPVSAPSQVASYRDAGQRPAARLGTFTAASPASPRTAEAPTAGPSRDVDWAQLGIGFALGIALAISLWLAMQARRTRPLAH
jgi:hypothetical protein